MENFVTLYNINLHAGMKYADIKSDFEKKVFNFFDRNVSDGVIDVTEENSFKDYKNNLFNISTEKLEEYKFLKENWENELKLRERYPNAKIEMLTLKNSGTKIVSITDSGVSSTNVDTAISDFKDNVKKCQDTIDYYQSIYQDIINTRLENMSATERTAYQRVNSAGKFATSSNTSTASTSSPTVAASSSNAAVSSQPVQSYANAAGSYSPASGNGNINRTVIANSDAIEGTDIVYDNINGQYYDLYVPENIEQDKPLIVYLPGIGGYGSQSNLQNDGGGAFDKAIQNGANYNSYVLSLQYPSKGAYNVDDIMNTIDTIADQYGVNKDRISIMGYSQGAMILPQVVQKYPNYFSSAVYVATNGANTTSAENVEALAKIPTYAFVGDQDGWACSGTKGVVDRLQAAGGDAHLVTYQGQSHAYMPGKVLSDTNIGDGNTTIVEWMLSQSKENSETSDTMAA